MKRLLMLLGVLGWLIPALQAQAGPACEDPSSLRVAFLPKSSRDPLKLYGPLLQALEQASGRRVEVLPMPSYGAIVEAVLSDSVDLAELGPASYAMVMERQGLVTVFATGAVPTSAGELQPMRYRSVLLVRRDSRLGSVSALRGKALSLTDPASTSGALLPRQAILKLTGQPLDAYFGAITYAGSHDLAIQAVQKRLVDAAFVSSSRHAEALRSGRVQAGELVELWNSPELPADPYVHRKALCRSLVGKIHSAFFSRSAEFEPMLKAMGLAGFVPVADADYQPMRDLFSASK